MQRFFRRLVIACCVLSGQDTGQEGGQPLEGDDNPVENLGDHMAGSYRTVDDKEDHKSDYDEPENLRQIDGHDISSLVVAVQFVEVLRTVDSDSSRNVRPSLRGIMTAVKV